MSLVGIFRRTVVEGRFVTFPVVLVILGMRLLLFLKCDVADPSSTEVSHLWHFVAPFFYDGVISMVTATLAVLLIAWLIRSMNDRFALIRYRSNLIFIAPLLLLSLHPRFLVMTPDLVAVIFIQLAFFPLLESYQKQDAYLHSFRSGVLIAIATLFHVGALALVPLWWRGERSMRGPQLRARLSYLFGFLLVGFSLFSLYFFLDDLPGFSQPFHFYASISLPSLPVYTVVEWVALVLILLFFLSNMIMSTRVFSRDKVITLTLMRFVVYLIIFLWLLQALYWSRTLFFFTVALTLISYMNAYFFTRTNSKSGVWLAYINLSVMLLFYLSHFTPFRLFNF